MRLFVGLLLSFGIASSASAVSIDWTPIGNPGNACELQPSKGGYAGGCFGSVAYGYSIGTYEVTNAQYTEFLNAVAAVDDPNDVYSTLMEYGGITRSGSPGSYTYSALPGREGIPVGGVTFYHAARFANWMNNGQPVGLQGEATTEAGAYRLSDSQLEIRRDPAATIFLPSEDEWYKAAYYDAITQSYFDYPTSSNGPLSCSLPTAAPNSASCFAGGSSIGTLANVGSYPGSRSPYGTFDQAGNLFEWNDTVVSIGRGMRGGSFIAHFTWAEASNRTGQWMAGGDIHWGFRLASTVPEPNTGLLVVAGLLGLAGWRRVRA